MRPTLISIVALIFCLSTMTSAALAPRRVARSPALAETGDPSHKTMPNMDMAARAPRVKRQWGWRRRWWGGRRRCGRSIREKRQFFPPFGGGLFPPFGGFPGWGMGEKMYAVYAVVLLVLVSSTVAIPVPDPYEGLTPEEGSLLRQKRQFGMYPGMGMMGGPMGGMGMYRPYGMMGRGMGMMNPMMGGYGWG
ncbi:hypothetical protein Q1695_012663 [Nippostrongylus brasiliensis]|nr:hypothetical protein Q1695_012663 [Nippostrongylus brasiliensis]